MARLFSKMTWTPALDTETVLYVLVGLFQDLEYVPLGSSGSGYCRFTEISNRRILSGKGFIGSILLVHLIPVISIIVPDPKDPRL